MPIPNALGPKKPGEPGFTGVDAHGHRWENGRQVAIGKDEATQPNPDGLDHLRPSKLTPTPEEKTAYYADTLKEKYGDKVLAKIAEVKAKYANDPAKVAALTQIEAKLTEKPKELPPSGELLPEFNLKPRKSIPSPLRGKT